MCRCRSRIERVLLWLGNSAQLIEHPSAGGEVRPRTGARERSVLLANLAASCRPPRQARHCQSSSSSPPPPFPSPDLRLSQVGEQAPTSPVVRPRGGEQQRPVVGHVVKGVLADTRDPLRYAEEAPVSPHSYSRLRNRQKTPPPSWRNPTARSEVKTFSLWWRFLYKTSIRGSKRRRYSSMCIHVCINRQTIWHAIRCVFGYIERPRS